MWVVLGVAALCWAMYMLRERLQARRRWAAYVKQKKLDDESGVTAQRAAASAATWAHVHQQHGRSEYQKLLSTCVWQPASDEAIWEAAVAYQKHMRTDRPTEATLRQWQDARLKWAADLARVDVGEFGNLVAHACLVAFLDSIGRIAPRSPFITGTGALARANEFHRYVATRSSELQKALTDWQTGKRDFVATYGNEETKAECVRLGLLNSRPLVSRPPNQTGPRISRPPNRK